MTTTVRQVVRTIEPQRVTEGAGRPAQRSIAGAALDYLDPFLLFDHFGSDNPRDYLPGFPMHPHRGIETVTYILEGSVNHRDSLGNAGLIGPGDVQWMTSGRGIMHEEMPRRGPSGIIAGFQLWVNLPAALKMTQPRYQEILSAALPEVRRDDRDGHPGDRRLGGRRAGPGDRHLRRAGVPGRDAARRRDFRAACDAGTQRVRLCL